MELKTSTVKLSVLEAKNINSQSLAFLGDGIFTLFVREKLVTSLNIKTTDLHAKANEFVCAAGQSNATKKLVPLLNENEQEVFKRARNYKTKNVSKSSGVGDYKRATGFEALLGFLYLTEQNERLKEFMNIVLEKES